MPKKNPKIKQSKFDVLPGFYCTCNQKDQVPLWILYSCWSFHHLSLKPLISSYQKKKNTGHQQQLLAMSNKSSTSFVQIQNKKWPKVNNLELYDKHLRCPQHKHLLPCWGELFTSAITKIINKACFKHKHREYRRTWMSEKKHMKLSSHHERRHRDKFFIYCKQIQMFTLAALHFDNFNSERGSKDLRGCSDQFWNTHELCYTDTARKARIAYPIRIGYGYVSDTPRIHILRVSAFLLFSCKLDTPSDTYLACWYGLAH